MLQQLAQDKRHVRSLVRAIGVAGDPFYVPWLIKQMDEPALARLAGEAFSLITGLDLAYLDLERKPPEGVDFGPNDDPDDDNVAMDEDDSLPWPDPAAHHRLVAGPRQRLRRGRALLHGRAAVAPRRR